MSYSYVIMASYGNDSCALIQWASENGLRDVAVLYQDTGWAHPDWLERVSYLERCVRKLGYDTHRTQSIGFEALVRKRKAFPRQGMQFCTTELKMKPAAQWLEEHDPTREATCLIGVRRCESKNRAKFPEHIDSSPNHGGRACWAPLVEYSDEERNALLARAHIDVLPHRSLECFPCVNSNRLDLVFLAQHPDRVAYLARFEASMGLTSRGKPRTMFRPYRHRGATGIREIVRWAVEGRGYEPGQALLFDPDDGTGDGCDEGWCGL